MEDIQFERHLPKNREPVGGSSAAVLPSPHSLLSRDRTHTSISGVTDVISFDESEVLLITTRGHLCLEGTGLHITVLNTGDGRVEISGTLCGLYYDDAPSAPGTENKKHKGHGGFFRRLFS